MLNPNFIATTVAVLFLTSAATHHSQGAFSGDFEYTDNGTSITIVKFWDQNLAGPLVLPSTIDGKPVTVIGQSAFWMCNKITGVTIPAGVTVVEDYAFSGCTALSSVQLPEGLAILGYYSFGYCPLKTIHLPSTLTQASETFGYRPSLEVVTFASGTQAIPAGVLSECRKVRIVTIPASVKRIENLAFYGCRKMEALKLPVGLASIGQEAFSACLTLQKVDIPSSVTSIGASAFYGTAIRKIQLPKNLRKLGEGTFLYCTELEEVRLPTGLREIPAKLFSKCQKLKTLAIPEGVTRIGESAFDFCPIERVSFPSTIREIEKNAFRDCDKLRTAIFTGKAPIVGGGIFADTTPDFAIFLEDSATSFTVPRWKGYPTSSARPEISILSEEDGLPNGGARGFSPGIIGKKDSYRNFTIVNSGNRPLTDLTAVIQGGNATDFVARPLKKSYLAPGKSVTLRVRFSPTEGGKRRSQLRIGSNDSNEDPYFIDLRAVGLTEN